MPIYEIANLLGFDASTLGNHDLDYGWQQTRNFIEMAKYPIVSSNLVDTSGKLLTPAPFVILRVNGLRVAVIGAMTNDLKNLSTPRLLGPFHTAPVVETVRKYAVELRDKSDLIVVLGHLTGDEEKQILESAPEIPVTVSGHIHKGLDGPIVQDGRLVVRVKSYAEELGRLELQVDTVKKAPVSWKWRHIEIDSTKIAPDAKVAQMVKHWEDEVTAKVDQPLAVSKKAFGKPELKKLMEQAVRDETGADFAFMNQGGVRDTLPEGQILVRNIWNIMPFDNQVVIGKFKGRDLPKVVVGYGQVDPDREYTLAVSDFTAANQATAENLRVTGLEFPKDAGLLRDLLLDWFRKKKVVGE
jgi:2',3'-cyclic-nucleotide 2'-phosphodiesterase (5'-nucleotidase family)